MRTALLGVGVAWVVVLTALACGTAGNSVGQACDPTLGGRDCQKELSCTYSYDDCPQNGCPKCRRACRADGDCPADDVKPCSKTAHCVQQQRTDYRGVCEVCDTIKPWFPP